LFSASQVGLVNNLNDALAWGLFPLMFADRGYTLPEIGLLAAIYPTIWGVGQLATGAWSDAIGRKPLIVGGMLLQSIGISSVLWAASFWPTALALAFMGAGTACVYPTLLATVSDVAHPAWRATSIGVYRLWRDGGYVVGALFVGLVADTVGMGGSVAGVALLTAASGLLALFLMRETLGST
jgi:MFS family permease